MERWPTQDDDNFSFWAVLSASVRKCMYALKSNIYRISEKQHQSKLKVTLLLYPDTTMERRTRVEYES